MDSARRTRYARPRRASVTSTARRHIRLVPCILALVACDGRAEGAGASFSRRHSCPQAQLSVKERPDLQYTPLRPEEPPLDVAADPARLTFWKETRASTEASHRHAQGMTTVYEVAGCGVTENLRCDSYEYVSCEVED